MVRMMVPDWQMSQDAKGGIVEQVFGVALRD